MYNRRAAFHIFSVFIQTPQLSTSSEPRQQTTVRPPGHQRTGTNHQSEWLLMELEQLPQTIRKGQKDVINSDVLKGVWVEGCSLVQNSSELK